MQFVEAIVCVLHHCSLVLMRAGAIWGVEMEDRLYAYKGNLVCFEH